MTTPTALKMTRRQRRKTHAVWREVPSLLLFGLLISRGVQAQQPTVAPTHSAVPSSSAVPTAPPSATTNPTATPTAAPTFPDEDGDGYTSDVDCNDNDPFIHPDQPELCGDGIDNNCDSNIDEVPCLQDLDGDGFVASRCDLDPVLVPAAPLICQDFEERFVPVGEGDCDDTNDAVFPGATEVCGDRLDNDCSGGDATCAPTVSPTSQPTVSSMPTQTPSQKPTVRPTPSPSAAPTASMVPTTGPSLQPSSRPTLSSRPSASPTSQPSNTPIPTNGPTLSASPTVAPVQQPTEKPSSGPSAQPTVSQRPSSGPSPSPSSKPSETHSAAPTTSQRPTSSPTKAPTSAPTAAPVTAAPTAAPVVTSTGVPTVKPTPSPVQGTPTTAPVTSAPTSAPSARPVEVTVVVSETLRDLSMTLGSVNKELDQAGIDAFVRNLESMSQTFFNGPIDNSGRSRQRYLAAKDDISGLTTLVEFDRQQLTDNGLQIFYHQTLEYRKKESSTVSPKDVVLEPFTDETVVEQFQTDLKSSHPDFETIDSVGTPNVPDPITNDPPPPEDDDAGDDGFGIGLVVAIAGAAGAIVIVLFAAVRLRRTRNKAERHEPLPTTIEPKQPREGGNTSKGNISAGEEVSAVSDPATIDDTKSAGITRGDQSIETVDYDYSKAYGGGENSVVSSAGGTMGENTRATGSQNVDSRFGGRAALGASFDSDTANSNRQEPVVQEQMIEVSAPPGKLGVVIDTPNTGAPVVHAVKDSSVIGGLINVGDQLIMVDDIDVSNMTAIKVSKLISKKSANPTRKLTIVRKVVIDSAS